VDEKMFLREMLKVLAGAVATPVEGYTNLDQVLYDVRKLRGQHDIAVRLLDMSNRVAQLEAVDA
jgi:hypothetical protein